MIANFGTYIEPLTIKSIKLLDGSNKQINFIPYSKKVLSDDTCYLLIEVLDEVMENNYWSIKNVKPNNVNVYAKTGTTSFDKQVALKNNIPSNASKDKWLASFTKDYSIACWSGFESIIKDEHTYFDKNSNDGEILKTFTKNIYSKIAKQNQYFQKPDSLTYVNVIKGTHLLPTDQIDDDFIETSLYKNAYVPTTYFKENQISDLVNYDYFILDDAINFIFNIEKENNEYNVIFDEQKILGNKYVYIDIYEDFVYKNTLKCEKIMTINLNKNSHYSFDIYFKYDKGLIDGKKVNISFIYN